MENHNKMIRNGRRVRAKLVNAQVEANGHWTSKLMDYSTINAFYYRKQNYAMVGPGLSRPPFFDANYPSYINYAALGLVIGHEITHGFDNNGREYDAAGNPSFN